MLPTYEAVLHGNVLDWGAAGSPVPEGATVAVHVTFLVKLWTPEERAERSVRLLAALEALAAAGGAEPFGDPVEWQRAERKDRPLPGREDD